VVKPNDIAGLKAAFAAANAAKVCELARAAVLAKVSAAAAWCTVCLCVVSRVRVAGRVSLSRACDVTFPLQVHIEGLYMEPVMGEGQPGVALDRAFYDAGAHQAIRGWEHVGCCCCCCVWMGG
jgi:hypothetical protein